MKALVNYFQGVRGEFAHIVWPSQRRAITDVILVALVSAITALLIAGLDYVFTTVVNYTVSNYTF